MRQQGIDSGGDEQVVNEEGALSGGSEAALGIRAVRKCFGAEIEVGDADGTEGDAEHN